VLVVEGGNYSGVVLDLNSLDLEEIGNALADQTDYEHRLAACQLPWVPERVLGRRGGQAFRDIPGARA
jgi:hypothetical protein